MAEGSCMLMSEDEDEADLPGRQISPVRLKPDFLLSCRGDEGALER